MEGRDLFRDRSTADVFRPSQEAMAREISEVMALRLSNPLLYWVNGYAEVGHRDPFLWNWCRRGVEVTMLSSVDPSLRDVVCDTRVLGVMLDVMLDDIADNQKDLPFLEYLLGVLEGKGRFNAGTVAAEKRAYARFTIDVWKEIQRRVRRFPRHDEFAELLRFDYRQLFNVMRYSRLLDEYPEMQNLVEHDLYTPHNMHMMISSTMDLMCSPEFDRSELGILREAVWRAQCMGRIGNLVTTWQREIGENDFTSGIFARALACGDLAISDLWDGNRAHLEDVIGRHKHEEYFLERWQALRQEILSLRPRCRSVDLGALAAGLERLICLHLGSRGKK
jgi:hypothetical protein